MVNRDFLLAGSAIFTVTNPKGDRYTYKVSLSKPSVAYPIARPFVYILTGPNNTEDYTYLGMLIDPPNRNPPFVQVTKATYANGYKHDSPEVKVATWAIAVILAGGFRAKRKGDGTYQVITPGLPEGYTIQHIGRCGRCGRALTVPESIEAGLGPDCRAEMGLPPLRVTRPGKKSRAGGGAEVATLPLDGQGEATVAPDAPKETPNAG